MEKKKYEVTMVVECEEGAQNYIADSVCDGLEDETCVTSKSRHVRCCKISRC